MAIVDWALYRDGFRESVRSHDEAIRLARADGGFVWIGLHEPKESELAGIAEEFGLHPLAVEDAVHAHQRPKLDIYRRQPVRRVQDGSVRPPCGGDGDQRDRRDRRGDGVPRRPLRRHRAARRARGTQAGPRAAARPTPTCSPVDRRLSCTPSPTMSSTPTSRSPTPSRRTSKRSRSSPFADQRGRDAGRMYQVKRELLEFRRAVYPLAQPLRVLAGTELHVVDPKVREYFRDVEDHLTRVHETVAGYDELLTRCCRPTWPSSRSRRTRTCARSPLGPRSSPYRRRSPASTA